MVILLFHAIYVSTAVKPFNDDDLVGLLQLARARNEQHRISGMLLYKDGHFMQVLEGEEADVMQVLADIQKDLRHKSVDILRLEHVRHRNFPDWTMGFANIDDLDPSTVPGFTRFLERDFTSEYFRENSVEAHAMLLAFKGVALA